MKANKHKLDVENDESEAKRPRRRLRSNSEPQPQAEEVRALKITARVSSADNAKVCARESSKEKQPSIQEDSDNSDFADEDDDVFGALGELDPEQLGFLMCAQETFRFLKQRGIPVEHPMFASLRSRFIKGMTDMGIA